MARSNRFQIFELCGGYNLMLLAFCDPWPSEYCEKYAKAEDIGAPPEDKSSDEELSEDESDSSDEQVAGKADP
jgi:hypothetical protein